MITINLLPEDLKLKAKPTGTSFELKYFLLLIPLFLAIVILLHFYLGFTSLLKAARVSALTNTWKQLQPKMLELNNFNQGAAAQSSDDQLIGQYLAQRICWSMKLNKLSNHLPDGVWFNNLAIGSQEFLLSGTVVSLQKEEMNLINKFISNLNADKDFMKDFSALVLSSVQKKTKGTYEITDFVLRGQARVQPKIPQAGKK
ncbi:MAG: PilN domain-containing protein [Candidatus Omnitrophota bacterium]|jgi:Tfp pilus assembly protein PilN